MAVATKGAEQWRWQVGAGVQGADRLTEVQGEVSDHLLRIKAPIVDVPLHGMAWHGMLLQETFGRRVDEQLPGAAVTQHAACMMVQPR